MIDVQSAKDRIGHEAILSPDMTEEQLADYEHVYRLRSVYMFHECSHTHWNTPDAAAARKAYFNACIEYKDRWGVSFEHGGI